MTRWLLSRQWPWPHCAGPPGTCIPRSGTAGSRACAFTGSVAVTSHPALHESVADLHTPPTPPLTPNLSPPPSPFPHNACEGLLFHSLANRGHYEPFGFLRALWVKNGICVVLMYVSHDEWSRPFFLMWKVCARFTSISFTINFNFFMRFVYLSVGLLLLLFSFPYSFPGGFSIIVKLAFYLWYELRIFFLVCRWPFDFVRFKCVFALATCDFYF